jgi:hypothetical protein
MPTIRSPPPPASPARDSTPPGDLDAKTRRNRAALTQARRAESKSGGEHSAGLLKR